MKHLELHILQSVPFSCLNRDDLGSPKSGFFGGVKRARISSQCWKRAIRQYAHELDSQHFQGNRTRLIISPLEQALRAKGVTDSIKVAQNLAKEIAKLDDKNNLKTKTIFFTSPQEIENLASAYLEKQDEKDALKTLKKVKWCDAADIALFGRMVAQDKSLTVEAASMFSHALSTHRADSESDFFVAVDDSQPDEESGTGMMGTVEFQSATYYRFVALNLDMLGDENHLACLTDAERVDVIRTFIKATLLAMPTARKNSMNGDTLPVYVLGIVREKGHPIQLVNAFEKPVLGGREGIVNASIKALKNEHEMLKSRWGINADAEFELGPDSNLSFSDFVEGIASNV